MDLFTQGVLGAAVGQAGFQKKLGRRAIVWGAILGMVPDLDVIPGWLSSDPMFGYVHHRGITHSLFFGPIMSLLFGWALYRYYRAPKEHLSPWIGLAFWSLLTHPLLDLFTTYGTQLLAPLFTHRFTLSGIAIIDPLYTGPLLVVILLGLVWPQRRAFSQVSASITLLATTAYLFFGLIQNERVLAVARAQLASQGLAEGRMWAHPTLFQIFYRRIVVDYPDHTRIGFSNGNAAKEITWYTLPKPDAAFVREFLQDPYVKIFRWFSHEQNIFTLTPQSDGHLIRIYDARYGLPKEAIWGLWGLQARLDTHGHLQESPVKFDTPITMRRHQIMHLIKEAFGL